MKISNINDINSESNKLINNLNLKPEEFAAAKSFLDYLNEIQNKIHESELKDKKKSEEVEKDVKEKIDSEIKNGSKLPAEIYYKIFEETDLKRQLESINKNINLIKARQAYNFGNKKRRYHMKFEFHRFNFASKEEKKSNYKDIFSKMDADKIKN